MRRRSGGRRRLFGDDVVGGPDVVAEARDRLEAHHWGQALLEPELIAGAVPDHPGLNRFALGAFASQDIDGSRWMVHTLGIEKHRWIGRGGGSR